MTSDDQPEARLRRLLSTQAEQLTDPEPRLTGPALRARAEPTGRRFGTPVLAAAAVLALFLLPLLLSRHDSPRVTPGGPVTSVVAPTPPRHSPAIRHSATRPVHASATPPPTLSAPSMSASPSVQTPTNTSPPISAGISAVTADPVPTRTD